jgi:pimeloyl-ACP methyl ester carboxylesterase
MASIILVHGAWHGAWCGEKVIPRLAQHHGDDKTPALQIQFDDYVQTILQLINRCEQEIILVGHSFGGMVISQVAELIPNKIKQLIYVAGILPVQGETMFSALSIQPPSRFVPYMTADTEKNEFRLGPAIALDFAFHLCSPADQASAVQRLCAEPLLPLLTPISLTEANFGQVHKQYLLCDQDHAITPATQHYFCQRYTCEITTIAADHSPFYSKLPEFIQFLLK